MNRETSINFQQLLDHRNIIQSYTGNEYIPPTRLKPRPPFLEQLYFDERFDTQQETLERMLEQIDRSLIVEDFKMIEERQEPYEEINGEGPSKARRFLDSESSGREIPSRNSSLSSVSSRDGPSSHFREDLLHPSTPTKSRDWEKKVLGKTADREEGENVEKMQQQGQGQVQEEGKGNILKLQSDGRGRAMPGRFWARREIDSSAQRRDRTEKVRKLQIQGCNCRKSRCLKMYCQCFNLQIFCGQNCNCCSCGNIEETPEHNKAVLEALSRNPRAFGGEERGGGTFALGVPLAEVRKGCRCRKTRCLKKYCECFHLGMACGRFCQCEGCANCGE